jgi:DNA-binding FadR family transcriptional regulator
MQLESLAVAASDEIARSHQAISEAEQMELAEQLDLSWDQVQPFVDKESSSVGGGSTSLRIVRATLDLASSKQALDFDELERLANYRIFFEVIIGRTIAASEKRRGLVARVEPIQSQLMDIAQSTNFSKVDAETAWKLDGRFHHLLFEAAGYTHLIKVVDMVIDKCKALGIATMAADVLATWEEHRQIIVAITADAPSNAEIARAVGGHVRQAELRWQRKATECQMVDVIQRERPRNSQHSFLKSVLSAIQAKLCGGASRIRPESLNDLTWQNEALDWLQAKTSDLVFEGNRQFERDLPKLLKTHANQWVAYRGRDRIEIGKSKFKVIDRCVSRQIRPEDLSVFKIELQVEEFVED